MSITSDRVKQLRKQRKKTQKQMAALFGLTEGAYRHCENGRSNFSVEQLNILADYFDVPVDYLLGNIDNPHGIVYTIGEDGKHYGISGLSKEEYELIVAQLEILREQQRRREEQD